MRACSAVRPTHRTSQTRPAAWCNVTEHSPTHCDLTRPIILAPQALLARATDAQAERLVRGYLRLCGDGPTEVPTGAEGGGRGGAGGGGGKAATVDGMGVRCEPDRVALAGSLAAVVSRCVQAASAERRAALRFRLNSWIRCCGHTRSLTRGPAAPHRRYKAIALVHADLPTPPGFETAPAVSGGSGGGSAAASSSSSAAGSAAGAAAAQQQQGSGGGDGGLAAFAAACPLQQGGGAGAGPGGGGGGSAGGEQRAAGNSSGTAR